MKKTMLISFVMVCFLGIVMQAEAQTVTKKATTVNYINKVEMIPVPDVEGHALFIMERRGVMHLDDGEVNENVAYLKADLIKGNGTFEGYIISTYKDGSKTISKTQGTVTLLPGEKLFTAEGKADFIKGTGRFEGIKGTSSYTTKQIAPLSKESRSEQILYSTITYTLPPK